MPSFSAIICSIALLFCLPVSGQEKGVDLIDIPESWGVPDAVQIDRIPDVSPPGKEEMIASIRKGVDFLLSNQNKNGSWGGHTNTAATRVACMIPSGARACRAAVTALCIIGLDSTPYGDEPKVAEAIQKAEDFLINEKDHLKIGNAWLVYNAWAHAYIVEALSIRAKKLPQHSDRYQLLKKCVEHHMKTLYHLSSSPGGWGYVHPDKQGVDARLFQPTSFMTATVLISCKKAMEVFEITQTGKECDAAIALLKALRFRSGSYAYSREHWRFPHVDINRHTGSLARSPACDLAIKLYEPDYISIRQLHDDLERLWSRTGWLTMSIKKPIPHESFAQNSGYFVFYGYYYVAQCLDFMPELVLKRHASQLVARVLPLQEKDGSWWDYPMYDYHKYYGTGYSLYAMSRAYGVLYGASKSED